MEGDEVLDGIARVARAHLGWTGPLPTHLPLTQALALDSVRRLTLVIELENHFRVCLDEEDESGIETVADLADVIRRKRGTADPHTA